MSALRKIAKLPLIVFRMIKTRDALPPNQVAFRVPLNINKIQIKHYLESLYGVKVARVNTMVQHGKTRLVRHLPHHKHDIQSKHSYQKQPDWKKAIVTLQDETFKFPL
jgi:large subunit ribosomal protein L23